MLSLADIRKHADKDLTIKETAKLLGCAERTVSRHLAKANIKYADIRKSTKQPISGQPRQSRDAVEGSLPSQSSTSQLSSPHGSGGAVSPPSNIPDDIKKISEYMLYFAQQGLTVKFNELLTYLDKTKQLNEQGGSELAQQLTTQQLLAVIKPNESLHPVPSPSASSSKASPSPTTPPTLK